MFVSGKLKWEGMMQDEKIIGSCGLNCSACPACIAYQKNDEKLRQKTAIEWQQAYDFPFKPEDINCAGCMNDGVKIGHCDVCQVRQCAKSKDLANCGDCTDFPCNELSRFLDQLPPELKAENLKNLGKAK